MKMIKKTTLIMLIMLFGAGIGYAQRTCYDNPNPKNLERMDHFIGLHLKDMRCMEKTVIEENLKNGLPARDFARLYKGYSKVFNFTEPEFNDIVSGWFPLEKRLLKNGKVVEEVLWVDFFETFECCWLKDCPEQDYENQVTYALVLLETLYDICTGEK